MTAGVEAVLTVLAGAAEVLPVDVTARVLVCQRCRRDLRIVLSDDPDGWTSGPCPDCAKEDQAG